MVTRDEAEKLAEKVLSFSKYPECSVTIHSSENLNLRFANNGVTTSGFTLEQSVHITSSWDRKTGTSRTDGTGEDALHAAVARSEELASISPANPELMQPLGPQRYAPGTAFDEATAQARSQIIVPQVSSIIAAARKHKLVAAGFFERTAACSAIANKNRLFGYSRWTDSHLSTTVRTPDGTSSGWASKRAVHLGDLDGAALAARAIETCLKWQRPVRLEPGRYTVLLEPDAVAPLVRSLGSGLDARAAEEGRSFLSRKGGGTLLGEKVFPDTVTLRTDPFDSRVPALPWSGDWLPVRPIAWIEKGVVRNLAYDRYWAQKAKKAPTPMPDPLQLAGGAASRDDLLRSVERGLWITHFFYIRMVNPKTLQMTGLTRDGVFLVEGGKVVRPVMNFRFNESPVRLLQNVTRLGSPVPTHGLEGGSTIAPSLVATDFTFTSISDAV